MTLTKLAYQQYDISMLSPDQCRAARGWLGWSQEELARRAKIGHSTLKDFESGRRTPMRNNLEALRAVLENAGVGLLIDEQNRPYGITANSKGT
ncbi:helix-turn-helix transcriptional regulator [Asaia bogorensis]|uniref:helix-turn-helix domain-containing protein n=1 Tax=Asaia bogorensis TaxID=91915 RepID=UPI000EFCDE15